MESTWREPMDVVEVLHDATPEQHRTCVQLAEMHVMNLLFHEQMKAISAHIGKASRSLERMAKAITQMHRNARALVNKFYGAAKPTYNQLAITYRM